MIEDEKSNEFPRSEREIYVLQNIPLCREEASDAMQSEEIKTAQDIKFVILQHVQQSELINDVVCVVSISCPVK